MVETILFPVPALLHAGVRVPLGFAVLDEPVFVPAAIAEVLIGFAFAAAAYAAFTRAARAWSGAVAAHVVALLGTLIGIGATFSGAGERTELDTVLHIVVLVVVLAGLALLLSVMREAALGGGGDVCSHGGEQRPPGSRPE